MAHKYKIKEAPAPNLAKQGNYKIGDVTYSKDGDTRFTVQDVDKQTGRVSWKITNLPNFDKLFDDINDAAETAKGVYTKVKDDEKFREFYEELKQTRNKIRTHLRKEYPEDYKRMTMNEEDVEEMSTSGGAGGYLTPYAFKPTKKKKKAKMGMPSGMVSSLGEEKDPGATLGPGPAASEDGVKDNAYVKQFKYQLVPKNKNGTYVQKGSGLEVKKLF